MLNIQLIIENQEVEISQELDFAINRTYEELANPTLIINDWSKTIQIPQTRANNRLFGEIFNIERRFINGDANIGTAFNPTKKATFQLRYNEGILMTGYAKLNEVDNVNKTYNINLFGEVGNTFLELLKCSFNTNTDNPKYIIPDYLGNVELTKELVRDSWLNDSPKISLDDEDITATDIIGFTPTICGLPEGFDADTMLDENGEFAKIANLVNTAHGINYGDSIIKDGVTEIQWGEYRTWNEKPYIYVNKLWQMLQKKSEEICEYPLKLDKVWFNNENPYYSELVYLCNDLSKEKMIQNTLIPNFKPTLAPDYAETFTIERLTGANVQDFNIYPMQTSYKPYKMWMSTDACIVIKITNENGVVISDYCIASRNIGWNNGYPESNTIRINNFPQDENGNFYFSVRIPLNGFYSKGTKLSCSFEWYYRYPNEAYTYLYESHDVITTLFNKGFSLIDAKSTNIYKNKNLVSLSNIWNPDINPFDILLSYAKMFGLVFNTNHQDKCIDVTCRNVYFSRHTFDDWSDKVNMENIFTIAQPTFGKKYINFNYEDCEGENYKGYKDKYNIQYGGKRLVTEYEFNDEEENLFNGIYPLNVANLEVTGRKQLALWQPGMPLPKVKSNNVLIDNRNGEKSLNLYSAFAFRRKNQAVDTRIANVKITEDCPLEVNAETYCYHGDASRYDSYKIDMNAMPYLSFIDESGEFGCLFEMPKDFYFNPDVMPYGNTHFIYDEFWKDYIIERYSTENKLITVEALITPYDYSNFQFNKYIRINNTLYVVNKIVDYSVSSNNYTKLELITIGDLKAYESGKVFDYMYFEPNAIDIDSDVRSVKVDVKANNGWHVFVATRGAATPSKTSGTGNDTITFTIQELAPYLDARTITINLLNEKGNVVDVLKIKVTRKGE